LANLILTIAADIQDRFSDCAKTTETKNNLIKMITKISDKNISV